MVKSGKFQGWNTYNNFLNIFIQILEFALYINSYEIFSFSDPMHIHATNTEDARPSFHFTKKERKKENSDTREVPLNLNVGALRGYSVPRFIKFFFFRISPLHSKNNLTVRLFS